MVKICKHEVAKLLKYMNSPEHLQISHKNSSWNMKINQWNWKKKNIIASSGGRFIKLNFAIEKIICKEFTTFQSLFLKSMLSNNEVYKLIFNKY